MRKKSKGINRLSIGLGVIGMVVLWIVALALDANTTDNKWYEVLLLVILVSGVGFLPGWGIPRLVHWIYTGFKSDTEAVQKQDDSAKST